MCYEKIKLNGKVAYVLAKKAYGGVEVQIHTFVTPAVVGGEGST
jgi:hypothetical protein